LLQHSSCFTDVVDFEIIEKIQRRAARKVMSKYGPNDMISELEWDTLERRRTAAKLVAMSKIINEEKAWKDFTNLVDKSRFPGRNKYICKLQIRRYNKDMGRHSFLGSTIPEWNNLVTGSVKVLRAVVGWYKVFFGNALV
jgi:hypothetical protein